jgi:hypothetical protein
MARNVDRVLRIVNAAARLIEIETAYNAGKSAKGGRCREARAQGGLRGLRQESRSRNSVNHEATRRGVRASSCPRSIGSRAARA